MKTFRKILLAEDDPNDVEITLTALAEHKLANRVEVVRDGAEALDYLFCRGQYANRTGGAPVVMLLDIKMPKIDGLEVLKQIREDPKLRCLPVVILTFSREERDLAKGYQLGANAYVVKPVDFEQFVSAVKEVGVFWALINEPPSDESAKGGAQRPADKL